MRAAVFALLLACVVACVEEDYHCRDDKDCNLGEDGACEVDHRCTFRSATCDTGREYGPLQGAISGTCYDERRDPLNPCAEGQPPARGENSCTAAVCAALPACCRSGWTEACVKQAQFACTSPPDEVKCDTRIAITAVRAAATELWTATFTPGMGWSTPTRYEPASSLSWFAPARGQVEPRLGVFTHGVAATSTPGTLLIDGETFMLEPRQYFQAQSVDLERNAHDVLLLSSTGDGAFYETFDLDTKERRSFEKQYTVRTVVGEVNRDGFPDIASCNNAGGYAAVLNEEDDDGRGRKLGVPGGDTINGQSTPGMNLESRSIEFGDVDGNGALDLVVAGRQIRLHMPPSDSEPLNASGQNVSIDCNPPQSPAGACTGAEGGEVSWVTTWRPTASGTTLVAAPWATNALLQPERKIYELTVDQTGIVATSFIGMGGCGAICNLHWVAIATRDLDHDHVLDLIAVDENLNIYTSKGNGGLVPTLMIDQPRESITNVRLTVTGAPVGN